jgi:phosphate-selective porin OprO/OprP
MRRRIVKIAKLPAWLVAFGTACLAQTALGDDVGTRNCGESVTAEILTILRDAGNIDAGQFEALCRKARGEETPRAKTVAAAEPSKPTWDFAWKDSFRLERSDGAYKLRFGGRLHLDGALIFPDSDLESDLADATPIGVGTRGNGVEFRRARFFFEGTVYERIFFKAQYDFAQPEDDDNPDFKDLFVGIKLGPVKDLRVGHFKEPMMLQEWTSSKYIVFMERGLNNVFFPGRNVGLMAAGDAVDKRLFWQTGIFRNTNDQGFGFNDWDDTEWNLAARLVGAPVYSDDGSQVIHLGASYIHEFLGAQGFFGATDEDGKIIGGNLRYRQRPSTNLARRFVDTQNSFSETRNILASDTDILNIEAAGVFGPLSVQTEYTNSWVKGAGAQDDLHFWGIYAQASWFLTGEHRVYDLGNGRYRRLKPKQNFNPGTGGWGAWEIAARYSYIDLTDENIRGGTLWDVTAALNWYLYPNFRWMMNYVYGYVGDRTANDQAIQGGSNMVQTRFAFDF